MSNIPNRAEYGNLSCMWGVFKSRFNGYGNTIDIAKLKYSKSYKINSVDICPGRLEFPNQIAEEVGRKYYCPFLESRSDSRVCQWVHSEDYDPQKSKPVGQTAIMLDAMGLVDLITTEGGISKKIKWTQEASRVFNYSWGSKVLDDYLVSMITGFGPIIALIYEISVLGKDSFRPNDLYGALKIIPSGELVNTSCSNGTNTIVQFWDGNTSDDAVVRTTASLLSLAASAGFVRPHGYSEFDKLTPSTYSNWINNRAKNSLNSFPRSWKIEKERIDRFMYSSKNIKKGVSYNNFIPKPTDRNTGNKCSCCGENVVNNSRIEYGPISKNRKLLLIRALEKAFLLKRKLDIRKLAQTSLGDNEFFISPESQYETLLNIERHNVSLYGCINKEEDGHLIPLINCSINAFGPFPNRILVKVDRMLEDSNIFVR
jgi:hypothetical protein